MPHGRVTTCMRAGMVVCPYVGMTAQGRAGMWPCPIWGNNENRGHNQSEGGAGKTTLAVHLGAAAVQAGHISAIIDLDPQATAASWGDRRQVSEPEVVSGQAVRLPALMKTARENGAGFLVLDTAPNADQTASLAARSADLVLIPCRASTFDLQAIETTLLLAKAAGKPAYVVLNAVPPRSGIGKEAAEGLTGRGAKVAPTRSPSEPPSLTASSMVE